MTAEERQLNYSILVALNDSVSSRVMIDYIASLPLNRKEVGINLLHVFRKPQSTEELMGQRFTSQQSERFSSILEQAKEQLVDSGFIADNIAASLVDEGYPTVAEGVIDQFKKGSYDMVVIGRKNMSKAEEFVRGDISIKLIRALEGLSLLVVKTP